MTIDDRKALAEIVAQSQAPGLRAGHARRGAGAQRPLPETLTTRTTPERTRTPMSNVLAQRWLLSRRHFLRGAGTALALPLLDAMTPLRVVGRRSRTRPRRSVFVYIPNGVNGMTWQVTKPGRGYELSPSLAAPGEAPRRVHRLQRPAPPQRARPGPRLRGHLADRGEDRRPERPAVSQHDLVRPAHGRGHVAAHAVRLAGALDQLGHGPAEQLDHAGLLARRRPPAGRGQPAQRLRPPLRRGAGRRRGPPGRRSTVGRACSTRCSTTPSPCGGPRHRRPLEARRIPPLRPRRRAADRPARRLARPPKPKVDGAPFQRNVSKDQAGEYYRTMFDLIVLALRTDMTRVVTYMNGSEGNGLAIPEIGITQSRHQLSHHGGDPEVLARLAKSDAFLMQQFAYFLDKLRGELDGGEPLLDRTMVLFGSGMSYGHSHSNSNLPILLAGGRGLGPQARPARRLQPARRRRLQARLRRVAGPLRQAEGREGAPEQRHADDVAEDGRRDRAVRRQPRPRLGGRGMRAWLLFFAPGGRSPWPTPRRSTRASRSAPTSRMSICPGTGSKPGEFPPPGSEHVVDGVAGRGRLHPPHGASSARSDDGELVDFTLLPFGTVLYLDAEADLRDVPLGTLLHFSTLSGRARRLHPGRGHPRRLLRACPRRASSTGSTRPSPARASSSSSDPAGRHELPVDGQTRVWKGDRAAKLGRSRRRRRIARQSLGGGGRCADVWAGAEARKLATDGQQQAARRLPQAARAGRVDRPRRGEKAHRHALRRPGEPARPS